MVVQRVWQTPNQDGVKTAGAGGAWLRGLGTALPQCRVTAESARDFSLQVLEADRTAGVLDSSRAETIRALISRIHDRGGIHARHSVIPDWLVSDPAEFQFFPPNFRLDPVPTTALRMAWYEREAVPLAEMAVRHALDQAQVDPARVTHLVISTCTGFFAPGLDVLLARRLGLVSTVSRTLLGFQGCYAGLVGMRTADQILGSDPRAVVLQVCIELCSLHYQKDWSGDAVVSGALFGDGASAAVWTGATPLHEDGSEDEDTDWAPPRARLLASLSDVSPDTLDHMSWRIGDSGFIMRLDVGVPSVLRDAAPPFVEGLLSAAGLSRSDVAGWFIHPGGRRILEVLGDALTLNPADLTSSFSVLGRVGNMSSATILFVLAEELQRTDRQPGPIVGLGFGPGLTTEGILLDRLP